MKTNRPIRASWLGGALRVTGGSSVILIAQRYRLGLAVSVSFTLGRRMDAPT